MRPRRLLYVDTKHAHRQTFIDVQQSARGVVRCVCVCIREKLCFRPKEIKTSTRLYAWINLMDFDSTAQKEAGGKNVNLQNSLGRVKAKFPHNRRI
jgi:hypothetical protein